MSDPDQDIIASMQRAREAVEHRRAARSERPGVLIQIQRFILVVTGAIVTILMTVQIVTRYLFGFSFYGIEELMSFFAIWMYFIGSAHGSWARGQISASLLDVALPFGRAQQALRLLACVVTTVLCAWMAVWASQYFMQSIQRRLMSLEIGIPLSWVYVIMPIGLFLMAFYALVESREEYLILKGQS